VARAPAGNAKGCVDRSGGGGQERKPKRKGGVESRRRHEAGRPAGSRCRESGSRSTDKDLAGWQSFPAFHRSPNWERQRPQKTSEKLGGFVDEKTKLQSIPQLSLYRCINSPASTHSGAASRCDWLM